MTQQAELMEKIDDLPPKYFGEVIDFVEYLKHKSRQESERAVSVKMTEAQEIELINRHADELNREAMDVLKYQWPDFSEEKLQEMILINRQAAEHNAQLNAEAKMALNS